MFTEWERGERGRGERGAERGSGERGSKGERGGERERGGEGGRERGRGERGREGEMERELMQLTHTHHMHSLLMGMMSCGMTGSILAPPCSSMS